jgi:hypothetical protein
MRVRQVGHNGYICLFPIRSYPSSRLILPISAFIPSFFRFLITKLVRTTASRIIIIMSPEVSPPCIFFSLSFLFFLSLFFFFFVSQNFTWGCRYQSQGSMALSRAVQQLAMTTTMRRSSKTVHLFQLRTKHDSFTSSVLRWTVSIRIWACATKTRRPFIVKI